KPPAHQRRLEVTGTANQSGGRPPLVSFVRTTRNLAKPITDAGIARAPTTASSKAAAPALRSAGAAAFGTNARSPTPTRFVRRKPIRDVAAALVSRPASPAAARSPAP